MACRRSSKSGHRRTLQISLAQRVRRTNRSIEEIFAYPIRDETLNGRSLGVPAGRVDRFHAVKVLAMHVTDPTLDVDEWRDELASIER